MVYNWINKLQLCLFPATCLLCGAPGEGYRDLCAGCRADLPLNSVGCTACAIPIETEGALICGQCQRTPPPFDRAFVPFRYKPPVDILIQDLKFRGQLPAARLLAGLLGDYLENRSHSLPEAVIPVPLHPARLRERGFNQAHELARTLIKRLGLPILADCVDRIRSTTPQSALNLKTRLSNVSGAFIVTRPVNARHIAILDDVVTTGSTVTELARMIRDAGVEEIEVWACARTAMGQYTTR